MNVIESDVRMNVIKSDVSVNVIRSNVHKCNLTEVFGGFLGIRWNQTKANNPIKLGWTNVTVRNFAVGQTLQSSKH